jgi:SAM-dependent methyltransferase
MLLAAIKRILKNHLPKSVAESIIYLKYAAMRLPNQSAYRARTEGKRGIEIGGPSTLFRTTLPIYKWLESLDGVNFSDHTVWEGSIRIEQGYNYIGRKVGVQFILDATDLTSIPPHCYDFLLSSNCLEHIANPLKALLEWKRILKPEGALVLVLPNKAGNFDHKRPFTSFEHLLDDMRNNTTEDDLTHLNDIIRLHDLTLDTPAGTIDKFRERSLDNFNNRTLHHHVFDIELIRRMLIYTGFEVISASETSTDIFALAIPDSKRV